MPRPTQKQIDAEVKLLAKMKPKVPRKSLIGDDHHAAIDAQIYVLSHKTEEDVIWSRYDAAANNIQSAAFDARQWLDGEMGGKPSDGWKELVR